MRPAPAPARGSYADGFEPVARCFAEQLAQSEIGAAFSVYQRGEPVVDLWGGLADVKTQRPWARDTRVVVFSVTKGLAAMALHLLAGRGRFDWDEPVAERWPGFAAHGKGGISIRTLVNHRAGLPYLDAPLTLRECANGARDKVLRAIEGQAPVWTPGQRQGYHATSFGLLVSELFQRIAGESIGAFLERELFVPVGSDARLGTQRAYDDKHARLYPPSIGERLHRMLRSLALDPLSTEARVARDVLRRDSIGRRAFVNPSPGARGLLAYDDVGVRRAELAWASATASADGIARAYLPFASGGRAGDRQLFAPETLAPLYAPQSWSPRDAVLHKALGWSQGFLKEERHLFSPHPESFGHPGIGGALGWCDPVAELSIGYVMNKLDWRIRSPRILELCRALYDCDPVWATT